MRVSSPRLASPLRSKVRTASTIRPRCAEALMARHSLAPTRRAVLAGGGALAAASLFGCNPNSASAGDGRLAEITAGQEAITLEAAEQPLMLGSNGASTPAWLYGNSPFPVLR